MPQISSKKEPFKPAQNSSSGNKLERDFQLVGRSETHEKAEGALPSLKGTNLVHMPSLDSKHSLSLSVSTKSNVQHPGLTMSKQQHESGGLTQSSGDFMQLTPQQPVKDKRLPQG